MSLATPLPRAISTLARVALVCGPGLVTMLADTDAGSIITAAQSGAQWGYRLLLLQFVLMPVLFIVQELTVRLGLVTGRGHGELIARHFGRTWAWVSIGTLLLSCLGALLSELSALAGVGLMFGLPTQLTLGLVVTGLTLMAYTGSYRSVERIAVAIGLFELVFLFVAWSAKPALSTMMSGSLHLPWRDSNYLYLVAANIGAVIMPWLVFFQQSAVVDKKLTVKDLRIARWDTAFGAVLTQLIMAAVLTATAAALGAQGNTTTLDTVQQIAGALSPVLGETAGRILFAMGIVGASLVATIVVTLTAARGVGEMLGVAHTLEHAPREAPWFYGVYTAVLIVGALLICSRVNLIQISVAVQVMNALLLPLVLGFLYLLARRLPEPHRLQGGYSALVASVILITAGLGVYAAILGVWTS